MIRKNLGGGAAVDCFRLRRLDREDACLSHRTTITDVINLAAPQTWTGSVTPAVVALAISYRRLGYLDPVMTVCFFAIVLLMQSAVNAFDDYADFVKGTDTAENSPDAYDAVIVYGMSPKTALMLGLLFLCLAAVPAGYVVLKTGYVPAVIGGIGALVLFWYAFGKYPLSYLPLGEIFCGFVLGGLVPLAGVYMQTRELDFFVLVEAIPPIMGLAVNMFSNNGCDIARDIPAGRHTLACLIGQKRTDLLYRILLILWTLSPAALLAAQSRFLGAGVYLLSTLAFVHLIVRQFKLQLGPEKREAVMTGATTLVSLVGIAYSFSMLLG